MPYMFGNMNCRSHKRLTGVIQKGDQIEATGYTGVNSGFSGEFEVRAVYHWGVYAKWIGKQSFRDDLEAEYRKRNWKIKWKNIFQYHLK